MRHPLSDAGLTGTPQAPGRTPHSASWRAAATAQPQAPLWCPGAGDRLPEASEAPGRAPATEADGSRDNDVATGVVVAVLLADGWHRIVRGSFSVGPLGLGAAADLDVPGFSFEEADTGSPHQPTTLAGPLDSIIAVRQVPPAVRRIGGADRARALHNGQRADHGARLRVSPGRWAAEG